VAAGDGRFQFDFHFGSGDIIKQILRLKGSLNIVPNGLGPVDLLPLGRPLPRSRVTLGVAAEVPVGLRNRRIMKGRWSIK
jgi:hypothetical protein